MRELNSVEEKILDRTLYLIGKTGTISVPVRAIAKEADVNVASINYYFRSKEELINKTKEFYIENVESTIEPLEDDTLTDMEKLKAFSERVMDYCIRFPGITILSKEARIAKNPDSLFKEIVRVTENMNQLLDQVLARAFKLSPEDIEVPHTILIASIVHPLERIVAEDKTDHYLLDQDRRSGYIDVVIKMIGDLPKHLNAMR
ncbi:TetR/AcrR family transcriptional regulator [Proteiniclasticum sp. C24MP]|uniref:TetR/AcrR family transcriptional regulator n=1 Tax=Proteiniclasticum sp. C24MP TaxID=3374101 RepID=UPI00375463E4